jgi:hypothetical protein
MADLTALQAIPAARARLDAQELVLIDQARREGATWVEIASALGLGSRQAAEQRRLRLASAAQPVVSDLPYGEPVATLRAATADLHRRVGADRRWDHRFRRAALVRACLAAAVDAPASGLFSLATAVASDLASAGVPLPAPTRAAVARLVSALEAATPQP